LRSLFSGVEIGILVAKQRSQYNSRHLLNSLEKLNSVILRQLCLIM
jgi:hypothetical protein